MVLEVLTTDGIAMNIKGILRPNVEVINPKMMLPSNPPKHGSDATYSKSNLIAKISVDFTEIQFRILNCKNVTQDASSMVILPDGNGDLSEVRITVLGLAHPYDNPNAVVYKLTACMSC